MSTVHETVAAYVGHAPPGETPLARLASKGPDALSLMELLGLVLGRSAQDAQHFLGGFNDLPSLARANVAELQRMYGVGPAIAARVLAAFELGRRNLTHSESRQQVKSPADAYNLVAIEMRDLDQEHLRLIVLDTKNFVLGVPTVYIGSLNTSFVRTGEVLRYILKYNAMAAIMLHNHPTGDATPSPEDVIVADKLRQAGILLDVEILDSIIVGRDSFVSLKERGLGGFK
jgi:DNA repair protein RadC